MNIEFIKWLVGYAEGFESLNNNDGSLNGIHYRHIYAFGDIQKSAVYPLLLQRAIEGINKTTVGTVIDQYCDYIEVTTDKKDLKSDPYNQMFPEDIGFDAAKEEALKYTWEKMG